MTENVDSEKYCYSRCGIRFDTCGTFSLPDVSGFGRNVIIFEVDNSSSVHTAKRKKDILILGKGPTDGLDDTILTAETECSIRFSEWQNKSCLSLH